MKAHKLLPFLVVVLTLRVKIIIRRRQGGGQSGDGLASTLRAVVHRDWYRANAFGSGCAESRGTIGSAQLTGR